MIEPVLIIMTHLLAIDFIEESTKFNGKMNFYSVSAKYAALEM